MTRVNDQHWSVEAEPVGEELVDLVADSVLARADAGEREVAARWRSRDVWDVVREEPGRELLDGDRPVRRQRLAIDARPRPERSRSSGDGHLVRDAALALALVGASAIIRRDRLVCSTGRATIAADR